MYDSNDGWTESALYQNYDSLCGRARLGRLLGYLTGRPRALRSLSQAMQGYRIAGQRNEGLKLVLLIRIVGSEGRSRDYDRDYRPLTSNTRQRWVSIACAQVKGVGLPPVALIRIGDEYYVCDGNHRVSVARAYGHAAIEAVVTEYQLVPRTAVEVPAASAGWAAGQAAAGAAA